MVRSTNILKMQNVRFLFIEVMLLCVLTQARSQSEFVLPRLDGPIILDGLSNEPAWQAIEPLPLTMYTPIFSGQPTERTEIRVAYDDTYLYMSGRLFDSDPSGIQGNSLIRDADRGGDFINLLLDTFNDNENVIGLSTTPTGNRIDVEMINDAEGPDFVNTAWNGFWETAVIQNGAGWFVEMRVPFSTLRFQSDNGRVVFGLMVHRLIGRKNERLTFPAVPPKWATGQFKASRARDVVLYGIASRKPLYITPYLLGGMKQTNQLSADAARFRRDDSFEGELGLDIKYGLASNVTLDLTVNTDFAQVEADDERFNLTRFSLFFPEKRQFFQERSGIFSFRIGGDNRLFHSRRIGLTRDGLPVRVLGGARIVARIDGWDVGILDMQTDDHDSLSAENFGVLRLRRRVFNAFSHIGAMLTSRMSASGHDNFNYGLDSVSRLFGSDYLTLNWVQTFGGKTTYGLNSSLARIDWQRRGAIGLGYHVETLHIGEDYDPQMGFILRKNVFQILTEVSYGWLLGEGSALRKHTPAVSNLVILRKADDAIETHLLKGAWETEMKSGTTISLEARRQYESLLAPFFAISEEVEIPAGDYTFYDIGLYYGITPGRLLRTNISLAAGSFFDGNRMTLQVSPTWNQSRYFELGAEYEFTRLRFPDRRLALDANILRLRIQGALNAQLSARVLLQYNSIDDKIGMNTRLRYNFREGHDLYLVYNESLNADRGRAFLRAPLSDSRTFLVKYIYTLLR